MKKIVITIVVVVGIGFAVRKLNDFRFKKSENNSYKNYDSSLFPIASSNKFSLSSKDSLVHTLHFVGLKNSTKYVTPA